MDLAGGRRLSSYEFVVNRASLLVNSFEKSSELYSLVWSRLLKPRNRHWTAFYPHQPLFRHGEARIGESVAQYGFSPSIPLIFGAIRIRPTSRSTAPSISTSARQKIFLIRYVTTATRLSRCRVA